MDPFTPPNQLADDLSMFQAAMHPQAADPTRPVVKTVGLLLDSSNQDETAQLWAQTLAKALGATVVEARPAPALTEVLAAAKSMSAELLVAPVPFGSDILQLRDESLGEVIDVLLCEASAPLLCVRQPADQAAVTAALSDVLLPLHPGDENAGLAAAWALHLTPADGAIHMQLVADADALAAAQLIAPGTKPDPEALARALREAAAPLIGYLQKNAAEKGQQVDVEASLGRMAELTPAAANARSRLTIVAGSRRHASADYHRAADVILGASGAVLVVA